MMTHLSLFSGIGGIDLAAEWALFTTVAFVEQDPFCQAVLKKHWPDVPVWGEIHDVTAEQVRLVLDGRPLHLISGGYPCPPFSSAGRQLAQADHRYLWPEMLRLVKDLKPRWVLAENVANHVRLGLDEVLSDLEAAGYEAGTVVLPACAVGAPHIRERVFVLAHTVGVSEGTGLRTGQPEAERRGRPSHSRSEVEQGSTQPRLGRAKSDGIPRRLDYGRWACQPGPVQYEEEPPRTGYGIPNRVARLKAVGNAVNPYQVHPILEGIAAQLRQEEATT